MGHFSWRNLTLVQLPEQWEWVPTFWSKPFLLLLVYDLALERWFLRTEIHKLTKNSYKPIIFQADTCLPVYNKGSNGKKDGSRTLGSTTIEKYLWPLFRYFCVFIQMHKLSITIMWNIINQESNSQPLAYVSLSMTTKPWTQVLIEHCLICLHLVRLHIRLLQYFISKNIALCSWHSSCQIGPKEPSINYIL